MTWIQEARTEGAGLIVNAGAFTHTSIALLDALKAGRFLASRCICRTSSRASRSGITPTFPAVNGVICGFGATGYELAIEALASTLCRRRRSDDAGKREATDDPTTGRIRQDLIRDLAELLEETGLTEIEIEHEGRRFGSRAR